MGKSFLEFRGRGFLVRDTPLQIWLRLVALQLDYRVWVEDAAFRDVRQTWLDASVAGPGIAGAAADLDRVLVDDALVEIATEAGRNALAALRRLGPTLDHRYLNLLGLTGAFTADYEAWRVVQVGEYFVRLLNGQVPWQPETSPLLPAAELKTGGGDAR